MSVKLNGITFCEDPLKDSRISSYVQTGLVDELSDCTREFLINTNRTKRK